MPIKSSKQYGMMQAIAHDKSILGNGPSKSVAKEFVAKTPAKKRKRFAQILKNKD